MSQQEIDAQLEEFRRIGKAMQGIVESMSVQIAEIGAAVADAMTVPLQKIAYIANSAPFQLVVLSERLARTPKIVQWLAMRLPLPIVRWLNRHWPERGDRRGDVQMKPPTQFHDH